MPNAEAVLGRHADRSTHVLAHPSVSKQHARIDVGADGRQTIRDLGSTNGTFVNDDRISAPTRLVDGDLVRIGPFVLEVRGSELLPARAPMAAGSELRTNRLTFDVRDDVGTKRLLDSVSLSIRPGEFVAIIGPSGCGKSTLIRILSGRAVPTSGDVSWNDVDLHRHFDTIKQDIAFVPQRETLPELLTVRQCLTYTARLRLPADTETSERDTVVNDAIAKVGLTREADLQIGRLSGGQRKRASLANELLGRPALMFLDEVTSGLDESTDREMMQLFRSLADDGIAVMCVTHTLANVAAWCDSMLVMAKGGVVAYHGPVAHARSHFDVRELGEVYQRLEHGGRESWAEHHAAHSPYHTRVHGDVKRAPAPRAASAPQRPTERRSTLGQLAVLVSRYFDIVLADRRTLIMAAVQSIVIGGFLRLVFGGSTPAPAREYQLVFLLGVSAFWFGCNNAAKEIIKENALFTLERDVNLQIVSYVLSKLLILSFLGALETGALFAIVQLSGLDFSHAPAVLGIMLLALVAGTGCGLLISAASSTEDQAVSIVPIALIPQILLSEAIIVPLPDAARWLSRAGIAAYWTYRSELQALQAPGIPGHDAWAMLAAHGAAYTLLAMGALWWKDHQRRT